MVAAAARPVVVGAVVSRGGRPNLAGEASVGRVAATALLMVVGEDREVLGLNAWAGRQMTCPTELAVDPGPGHLFEQPRALEHVGRLAALWFRRWLTPEANDVPV